MSASQWHSGDRPALQGICIFGETLKEQTYSSANKQSKRQGTRTLVPELFWGVLFLYYHPVFVGNAPKKIRKYRGHIKTLKHRENKVPDAGS